MPNNDVLELFDYPPTWRNIIFSGLFGMIMCCCSIGLLTTLFIQENHFFEIVLAIIMVLGSGFVGIGFLTHAYEDRAHVRGERKLRYSFYSDSVTDHNTGQRILWDDFITIKGNAENGLKFSLKIPPKTIYLYQGFSVGQRQEVIGFLKVHAPHEKTLWLV